MLNDIRKDYLLERWVVIATHRGDRPTDFARTEAATRKVIRSSCPFCPGNESKTPPATLLYLKGSEGIYKDSDKKSHRHKNWLIRCVPNLFAAFSPPERDEGFQQGKAVGHHEVLIESPRHSEHPAVARKSQLIHVIEGYRDRLQTLSAKPYVQYVSIFRNHGEVAGASLSHAHSQIIATPMLPRIPAQELDSSKKHYDTHGTCVFCSILKEEREGPRFIWENEGFLAFTPWASIHPYEFWVFPKAHASSLLSMQPSTVAELADALKVSLGSLKSCLNDPPYNYGFHIAPRQGLNHFHWHLEVYPRLTIWAGFEKNNGVYINIMTPEKAAKHLRQTIASR